MFYKPANYFACFLTILCFNSIAETDPSADYAFMSLIILSPDFSAANYTLVDNEVDIPIDTDISIIRLPHSFDLSQDTDSLFQLEVAVAYQSIKQLVPIDIAPGDNDNVDTRWDTYAVGVGLLYEYGLTQHLKFTPSLRLGITNTENHATFNGPNRDLLEDEVKDELNWKTDAGVLNAGLGLSYNWHLLDRASSAKANIYYSYAKSFNESKDAARFSDSAGLLALKNDMIFPSDYGIYNSRLDFVLLLGINHFFGENRNTLGYTTSYLIGAGIEFGLASEQKTYGHIRFSGQMIQAENLDGWLLTIGYYPE